MNFVQLRATHHPDLLFCDFNQDATCVSVGSSSGCRLYRCHPLELIYEQEAGGSLGVVEMLFGTSLLATVGGGDQPAFSPRTLRMWNTKSGKALCELNFDAPIIGVRLNKKRVAVVLQHRIGVFDLNTMESLQSLATVHNPKGLCALSPNAENCFLVFPKATDKGDLIVYDALSLNVKNVFKAHVSPIAAMAISSNGRLLATASETGTLIRVFSLPAGTRQYVFRRGSSSASISCLSFSQDGHFLVAAGSTQTIHVYKLGDAPTAGSRSSSMDADDSSAKPSAMASVIDGVVSSAMSLGGVIEGERDFARIRVRSSGVACLCAITSGRVGQRRVARPSSIAAADGGAAAAAAATTGQVVSAAGGDADASAAGAASDGGSGGGAGSATATTTTTTTATSTAVTSDSDGGGTTSSSTAGTATSSGDAGGAGRGGAAGAGAGGGAGGGAGAGAGVGAGDSDNGTTGSSGSGAGSSASKSPAATAGPSAATGSSAAKADEPIRYYATVVTSDGVVSQYLLDTEKGGDCKLQHEHVLARSASEAIGSAVLS